MCIDYNQYDFDPWSAAKGGRAGFGQGTDDPDKRVTVLDKEFDELSLEELLLIKKLIERGELRYSRGELEYNQGGRAGFDKGSKPKNLGRRAFIKGLGALAVLPIVGKFFKTCSCVLSVLERSDPSKPWYCCT